jgi:hypothetical protein
MNNRQYPKDLTGMQFNNWKVEEFAFTSSKGIHYFKCRCSCGIIRNVSRNNLISGGSNSCGHDSNKDQLIDITGQEFGELTALEYIKEENKWLCRCSCGNEVLKRSWDLRNGKGTTCGVRENHSSKKLIDLIGKQFGDLTVEKYTGEREWLCRCSCGKTKIIQGSRLRDGSVTSCGHDLNQWKVIDIAGKQFGKLKALRYVGDSKWDCKCSCGEYRVVPTSQLTSGKVTMCMSCLAKHIEKYYNQISIDLTGKQFGELTVVEPLRDKHKWLCKCSCGKYIEVRGQYLRRGDYKTCGHTRVRMTDGELRQAIIELERSLDRKPYIDEIMMATGYKSEGSIRRFLHNNDDVIINKRSTGSSLENKVITILNNSGIEDEDIVMHYKTTDNTEIDLFIPRLSLGIEVNGSYWHSDVFKDNYENRRKIISAYKDGIKLIILYDFELVEKYEEIKDLIWDTVNGTNKNIKDFFGKEIDIAKCPIFLNIEKIKWCNNFYKYVNHSGTRLLTIDELEDTNEIFKSNRISISSVGIIQED